MSDTPTSPRTPNSTPSPLGAKGLGELIAVSGGPTEIRSMAGTDNIGPSGKTINEGRYFVGLHTAQHDPLSRSIPPGGSQVALQRARPPRRVGFSPNFGLGSIDPEVARICRAGAQRFAEMDCVVDEEAPDFSGAIDRFSGAARPPFR